MTLQHIVVCVCIFFADFSPKLRMRRFVSCTVHVFVLMHFLFIQTPQTIKVTTSNKIKYLHTFLDPFIIQFDNIVYFTQIIE
jgi:hypothetical protein